jgi:hypothetical protein
LVDRVGFCGGASIPDAKLLFFGIENRILPISLLSPPVEKLVKPLVLLGLQILKRGRAPRLSFIFFHLNLGSLPILSFPFGVRSSALGAIATACNGNADH